jgi:hypothetical protein
MTSKTDYNQVGEETVFSCSLKDRRPSTREKVYHEVQAFLLRSPKMCLCKRSSKFGTPEAKWNYWKHRNRNIILKIATGSKVSGFKPSRGRQTFKGDKLRRKTSFGGEMKPSVLCRKTLRHCEEPFGVWKRYFVGKIHGHFSPRFFVLRYWVSLQVTARELWYIN